VPVIKKRLNGDPWYSILQFGIVSGLQWELVWQGDYTGGQWGFKGVLAKRLEKLCLLIGKYHRI